MHWPVNKGIVEVNARRKGMETRGPQWWQWGRGRDAERAHQAKLESPLDLGHTPGILPLPVLGSLLCPVIEAVKNIIAFTLWERTLTFLQGKSPGILGINIKRAIPALHLHLCDFMYCNGVLGIIYQARTP